VSGVDGRYQLPNLFTETYTVKAAKIGFTTSSGDMTVNEKGGAHVNFLCDASVQTFMLTHWARDAAEDERFPLEHIVRKQNRATAELYGMLDRGALKPCLRADVNLIDFDNLQVGTPKMVFDLPTGAQRIM
jgi:N-acyl-D-amino-acid deacylase